MNPGNRFESIRLEVLGEHLDEVMVDHPEGRQLPTRVYADRTRTVINHVDSPDLWFNWTINPYRGCEHGCAYCYARPGHELLGFSCGLDFETRLMAKTDAPAILRKELSSPKWEGEPIVLSGVTDPYQPVEATLRITRGLLEVCAEFRQPVAMVTKNHMITRDVDLLADLARDRAASAAVSVTTLDNRLASKMEPRASSPAARLKAIEALSREGVPVSVMAAPIIPGLTDHEVPTILKAAKDAGATGAAWILLRLPHGVKEVFGEWIAREFPERAGKVESLLRQARDGGLYRAKWGERRSGTGAHAEQIARTVRLFRDRYGMNEPGSGLSSQAFRRAVAGRGQLQLFMDG